MPWQRPPPNDSSRPKVSATLLANVLETTKADVISVDELMHKLIADAKSLGIRRGEIDDEVASLYQAILDAIVHDDPRIPKQSVCLNSRALEYGPCKGTLGRLLGDGCIAVKEKEIKAATDDRNSLVREPIIMVADDHDFQLARRHEFRRRHYLSTCA